MFVTVTSCPTLLKPSADGASAVLSAHSGVVSCCAFPGDHTETLPLPNLQRNQSCLMPTLLYLSLSHWTAA